MVGEFLYLQNGKLKRETKWYPDEKIEVKRGVNSERFELVKERQLGKYRRR